MQATEIMPLTEENFGYTTREGLTLVDFWAPWCGPCQMQGAVLEELARTGQAKLRIAKVNVDNEPYLAARFRVSAIPLVVLLKDGQELVRLVGFQDKADLVQTIERFRDS